MTAQPVEKQAGEMQLNQQPSATNGMVRVQTRTKRRAMDWSLVLASQGILAVIEDNPESGWSLVVPVAEHQQALEAITTYRRENVRWPWRLSVNKANVIFDWASVLWVLLTWIFFYLEGNKSGFRDAGVVDSTAITHGEWWRLFTAELLHADGLHLATNGIFGFLLLGLAMGRFGTGIGFLAAYLGGAAGNYFSLLLHPETHRALGASGLVMAALGLLAAPSLGMPSHPRGWKTIAGGLAAGIMLFVLLGLHPGSDVAAHFGGFVAGVAFGAFLSPFHKLGQKPAANLIAGSIAATMIICPWFLALRNVY